MDAKEKAEELVDNFRLNVLDYEGCGINEHKAKQCALISVDEIIKSINPFGMFLGKDYWEEVRDYLENY
jgi:hypothetical protein